MSLKLAVKDWLDVLDSEYLQTFIAEGGAAVKVAVGDAFDRSRLAEAIASLATQRGYFAIPHRRGQVPRPHAAGSVPCHGGPRSTGGCWRGCVYSPLAAGLGYNVDGIGHTAAVVPAIAELGGIGEDAVKMELRRALHDHVLASVRMGRDFRGAMFPLVPGRVAV